MKDALMRLADEATNRLLEQSMTDVLKRLVAGEEGATMVENVLMITPIASALSMAVATLGSTISASLDTSLATTSVAATGS